MSPKHSLYQITDQTLDCILLLANTTIVTLSAMSPIHSLHQITDLTSDCIFASSRYSYVLSNEFSVFHTSAANSFKIHTKYTGQKDTTTNSFWLVLSYTLILHTSYISSEFSEALYKVHTIKRQHYKQLLAGTIVSEPSTLPTSDNRPDFRLHFRFW